MNDLTPQKVTNLASSPLPKLSRFQQDIRVPDQMLCPDGVVFDDLERTIKRHLYINRIPSQMDDCERMLIIEGQPGVGKSVAACDAVLRFGMAVLQLPAERLAGDTEGASSAALTEALEDLVAFSATTKLMAAVVIDDFDLSTAGDMDTQLGKTVNSALLAAQLQRLADKPKSYRNWNGTPIPFLFTGNDFTRVRSSLFRDGRATWFTHAPTHEQKIHIAFHLLKPQSMEDLRLVEKVVRTYRQEPIAFFRSLRNDLLRLKLDSLITDGPADTMLAERELAKGVPLDPDKVWAFAKARATKRKSFL